MENLLLVIRAWTHKDDWNADTIYLPTIERLASWLDMGFSVELIVAHATHSKRGCCGIDGK